MCVVTHHEEKETWLLSGQREGFPPPKCWRLLVNHTSNDLPASVFHILSSHVNVVFESLTLVVKATVFQKNVVTDKNKHRLRNLTDTLRRTVCSHCPFHGFEPVFFELCVTCLQYLFLQDNWQSDATLQ